jgi:DNA-binding XRE family transcriptional regulator
MKNESIKLHTLDELIEKNIGEKGSPQRDEFESELQMSVMGSMIREARLKRNLTQAELGKRVGVQRAQISRIENSLNSASINTLSRIFKALDAEVTFTVRLNGKQL